jgi:hypothetical protein
MGEIEQWLVNEQVAPLSGIADDAIRQMMSANVNLMDNTTRGTLGEVLVAHALGGKVTPSWNPWDVTLSNGTKIEVKTTGLIQSWSQTTPSLPSWSIAPAAAWQGSEDGHTWSTERIRSSDWYLFALHQGVRPGDPGEWSFRPVKTDQLNELVGHQRRISLASLDRLFSPLVLSYADLPGWARGEGFYEIVGSSEAQGP